MHLIVDTADGHFEEKKGSKYLNSASTDENKEVFKKDWKLSNEIKYLIKTIHNGKSGEYGKDFMKIKFNSYDYLLINKTLKFHTMTRIIRSVFEVNRKYYWQTFLDECLL